MDHDAFGPCGEIDMTAKRQKDVALSLLAAMGRFDIAAIAQHLTPDAEYWVLGHMPYDTPVSREQFLATMKLVGEQVFDGPLNYSISGITAGEDRVAIEAASRGTLRRGGEFRNLYHFLFQFEGDKVRLGREYGDTALMAKALGEGIPGAA
jgi:ketosteroid isomerase-like protein